MRSLRLIWVPAAILLAVTQSTSAQSSTRMSLIGVGMDDGGVTLKADARLSSYLTERAGIRFTTEELEYGQVINRLLNWRPTEDPYVARVTPYAFLVAELLGANVDTLATYTSAATNRTTYRSYFVVNRSAFERPPTLQDVLKFLAARRAKFVYHNEYSTSSFFLPSLVFRSHNIFNMAESTERLTAIGSTKIAGGSSALVERVANGEADIAAVWDAVKDKFVSDPSAAEVGRRVYFVELPTPMPNDLLVCPSGLDDAIKEKLHGLIGAMPADAIGIGDFRSWQDLTAASEARLALSELRQLAQETSTRIPVELRAKPGAEKTSASLLEAGRQALRLSETEFALFDADYHTRPDMLWTLEPIHDGAVVLRSAIPGYEIDEQSFQVSFRDFEDLTARLVSIIQTRLHRIRYVWSYSGSTPIVLRNSVFDLPVGAPVRVQRITWVDPMRNQFLGGEMFLSRISRATFYRYDLSEEDFNRPAAGQRPDALSNAAYRVILERPIERHLFFRILTVTLVALFVLAGVTAAWSLVRDRPRLRTSSAGSP